MLGLGLAAALWWLYFEGEDARAEDALERAPQERRPWLALNAFGYVFLPILGGIVVIAAGLKLALVHYNETATGSKFDVVLRPDNTLAIQNASGTFQDLIPWQANRFRIKEFPDVFFEFVVVNGRVTELKQTTPGGEFRSTKKS